MEAEDTGWWEVLALLDFLFLSYLAASFFHVFVRVSASAPKRKKRKHDNPREGWENRRGVWC